MVEVKLAGDMAGGAPAASTPRRDDSDQSATSGSTWACTRLKLRPTDRPAARGSKPAPAQHCQRKKCMYIFCKLQLPPTTTSHTVFVAQYDGASAFE